MTLPRLGAFSSEVVAVPAGEPFCGPPAPDREALLMGCLSLRPPYQKYDVAVRRSPIDGFGVFALEPVPGWHKIGEVRGETISIAEARRRAATLERIMIVEVSHKTAVDLARSTDPMRFTNHSCQPNGQLRIREGRIEFYALREIAVGEEITVDYGETHHEGRLACRCGAVGCVGRL